MRQHRVWCWWSMSEVIGSIGEAVCERESRVRVQLDAAIGATSELRQWMDVVGAQSVLQPLTVRKEQGSGSESKARRHRQISVESVQRVKEANDEQNEQRTENY